MEDQFHSFDQPQSFNGGGDEHEGTLLCAGRADDDVDMDDDVVIRMQQKTNERRRTVSGGSNVDVLQNGSVFGSAFNRPFSYQPKADENVTPDMTDTVDDADADAYSFTAYYQQYEQHVYFQQGQIQLLLQIVLSH